MAAPPPRNSLVDAYATRARRSAVIKLTPLIDVVFILLVFFMLASSFHDWRSVDLSAPASAAAGGALEGSLLIEVRHDSLRLAGETLSITALTDRVAKRLEQIPDQRVLVKPAPGVALQSVVQVLDRLSAIGVADLSLLRDTPG